MICCRAWCSTSGAYERCKQLRSVVSLPQIAGFLCGDIKNCKSFQECCANGDIWLPTFIEVGISFKTSVQSDSNTSNSPDGHSSRLIVSCCFFGKQNGVPSSATWITYNGSEEITSSKSFFAENECGDDWAIHKLQLLAVLSSVSDAEDRTRAILHLRRNDSSKSSNESEWILYNDFTISPTTSLDSVSFQAWKTPVYVAFARTDFEIVNEFAFTVSSLSRYAVPVSVLAAQSLSSVPCIRLSHHSLLPQSGEIVAFDGEFVSLSVGSSEISNDGQRVVNEEGRQVLARMSLVTPNGKDADEEESKESQNYRVLLDDYILPGEQVMDYVTRYSGITEEYVLHSFLPLFRCSVQMAYDFVFLIVIYLQ